ncbi:hypothetical protein [Mobilicoccus caccae]|nr:hypothetical protein [Mobilicoccus caccae]
MRHTDAGHVTVTETARTERAAGSATRHDDLTVAEVIDGVRELGVELGREDREALTRTLERIRSQAHGT